MMPGSVNLHLTRHIRARTDPAHFPSQHINDLRQLVYAGLAQYTPYPGDLWATHRFEDLLILIFGTELPSHESLHESPAITVIRTAHHCAKFVHSKQAASLADSRLYKDNRTRRIEVDRQRANSHNRQGDRQKQQTESDVHRALRYSIADSSWKYAWLIDRHQFHMASTSALRLLSAMVPHIREPGASRWLSFKIRLHVLDRLV